jgi:hypothetical protein
MGILRIMDSKTNTEARYLTLRRSERAARAAGMLDTAQAYKDRADLILAAARRS